MSELKLKIGDSVPDFDLPDQDGHQHTLSSMKGSPVVLFVYPEADTPG